MVGSDHHDGVSTQLSSLRARNVLGNNLRYRDGYVCKEINTHGVEDFEFDVIETGTCFLHANGASFTEYTALGGNLVTDGGKNVYQSVLGEHGILSWAGKGDLRSIIVDAVGLVRGGGHAQHAGGDYFKTNSKLSGRNNSTHEGEAVVISVCGRSDGALDDHVTGFSIDIGNHCFDSDITLGIDCEAKQVVVCGIDPEVVRVAVDSGKRDAGSTTGYSEGVGQRSHVAGIVSNGCHHSVEAGSQAVLQSCESSTVHSTIECNTIQGYYYLVGIDAAGTGVIHQIVMVPGIISRYPYPFTSFLDREALHILEADCDRHRGSVRNYSGFIGYGEFARIDGSTHRGYSPYDRSYVVDPVGLLRHCCYIVAIFSYHRQSDGMGIRSHRVTEVQAVAIDIAIHAYRSELHLLNEVVVVTVHRIINQLFQSDHQVVLNLTTGRCDHVEGERSICGRIDPPAIIKAGEDNAGAYDVHGVVHVHRVDYSHFQVVLSGPGRAQIHSLTEVVSQGEEIFIGDIVGVGVSTYGQVAHRDDKHTAKGELSIQDTGFGIGDGGCDRSVCGSDLRSASDDHRFSGVNMEGLFRAGGETVLFDNHTNCVNTCGQAGCLVSHQTGSRIEGSCRSYNYVVQIQIQAGYCGRNDVTIGVHSFIDEELEHWSIGGPEVCTHAVYRIDGAEHRVDAHTGVLQHGNDMSRRNAGNAYGAITIIGYSHRSTPGSGGLIIPNSYQSAFSSRSRDGDRKVSVYQVSCVILREESMLRTEGVEAINQRHCRSYVLEVAEATCRNGEADSVIAGCAGIDGLYFSFGKLNVTVVIQDGSPEGMGSGGVDSDINNLVAIHHVGLVHHRCGTLKGSHNRCGLEAFYHAKFVEVEDVGRDGRIYGHEAVVDSVVADSQFGHRGIVVSVHHASESGYTVHQFSIEVCTVVSTLIHTIGEEVPGSAIEVFKGDCRSRAGIGPVFYYGIQYVVV